MRPRHGTFLLYSAFLLMLLTCPPNGHAQGVEDSGATTELSCSFAMEQGETGSPCRVPFPQGCVVASIPGTKQPWATVSKGGRVQCRFDEKETDWKTKITGACGRCQSIRCSAHFSVRFGCTTQQ
ncbi:hypothetical protein [Candidatus Nitrospira nitrosa]|uniref:hypothetical protein n=1 Tax=Candidatus Nitrospira nitrosa TaxID=1742972 RepID=UPI001147284D|nr:hypothetical protein [Candidatus Nitrospira nitrosa]